MAGYHMVFRAVQNTLDVLGNMMKGAVRTTMTTPNLQSAIARISQKNRPAMSKTWRTPLTMKFMMPETIPLAQLRADLPTPKRYEIPARTHDQALVFDLCSCTSVTKPAIVGAAGSLYAPETCAADGSFAALAVKYAHAVVPEIVRSVTAVLISVVSETV